MYLGGTLKGSPWEVQRIEDLLSAKCLAGNYILQRKGDDYYLLMLFGNFLFFFPFSPDIFILIFSLIKAAEEVVKNAKKFITLTGGWIFTEKFTNSIKLQSKRRKMNRKIRLALRVRLFSYIREIA